MKQYVSEDQFSFQSGKVIREAIFVMWLINGRNFALAFIDLKSEQFILEGQKAYIQALSKPNCNNKG